MLYEKLNLKRFEKKLTEGFYKTQTAARRGIGRAGWGIQEKKKATKMCDEHYERLEMERAAAPRAKKSQETSPVNMERVVLPPVTTAEIIQFCGVANECIETMRKSTEVVQEIGPTLKENNVWLGDFLRAVGVDIRGAMGAVVPSVAAKAVREPGRKIAPQLFIQPPKNGAADPRSAVGE